MPVVLCLKCISGGGECDDNMFQIVWRAYLFWIPRENKTREKEGGERGIQKALGAVDDTL